MNRISKKLLGFCCLILAVFFNSCQKESYDQANLDNLQSFSGFSAFNAIQGTKNLQLLVDNKVVNKTGEEFGTGGYLGYRTIFPGKRNLELSSLGNQTYFKREDLFDVTKIYTYFFYGKTNVQVIVTEDETLKSNPGKLKIRVINLLADGKIKLDFNYSNSKVSYNFENRIYGYSEYNASTNFKFLISSTDKKYNDMEIAFTGKDRSVNTIVIYSDLNAEGKEELKYKILEL